MLFFTSHMHKHGHTRARAVSRSSSASLPPRRVRIYRRHEDKETWRYYREKSRDDGLVRFVQRLGARFTLWHIEMDGLWLGDSCNNQIPLMVCPLVEQGKLLSRVSPWKLHSKCASLRKCINQISREDFPLGYFMKSYFCPLFCTSLWLNEDSLHEIPTPETPAGVWKSIKMLDNLESLA